MSGNSEKVIIDFPPCPHCDDFDYWSIVKTKSYKEGVCGTCLNPDAYLGRFKNAPKVNHWDGFEKEDLDAVTIIECNNCDEAASEELTKTLIELAKHYYGT